MAKQNSLAARIAEFGCKDSSHWALGIVLQVQQQKRCSTALFNKL